MGETRHPSRGTWRVYEGEGRPAVASTGDTLAINRELEWPLAFVFSRIVDRTWTVLTVEVAEDLSVTHKLEQLDLDDEAAG